MCHRGYHGDLNETFLLGNVSKTAEKLVNVTWECLEKAIQAGMILMLMLFVKQLNMGPQTLELSNYFLYI